MLGYPGKGESSKVHQCTSAPVHQCTSTSSVDQARYFQKQETGGEQSA